MVKKEARNVYGEMVEAGACERKSGWAQEHRCREQLWMEEKPGLSPHQLALPPALSLLSSAGISTSSGTSISPTTSAARQHCQDPAGRKQMLLLLSVIPELWWCPDHHPDTNNSSLRPQTEPPCALGSLAATLTPELLPLTCSFYLPSFLP